MWSSLRVECKADRRLLLRDDLADRYISQNPVAHHRIANGGTCLAGSFSLRSTSACIFLWRATRCTRASTIQDRGRFPGTLSMLMPQELQLTRCRVIQPFRASPLGLLMIRAPYSQYDDKPQLQLLPARPTHSSLLTALRWICTGKRTSACNFLSANFVV